MRGARLGTRIETNVGLKVDPRVVLSSKLLTLGRQELDQAIDIELQENPALERLDGPAEAATEEEILKVVAPQELGHRAEYGEFLRSLPQDEGQTDWIDLAPSETTLQEHLRAQLCSVLKGKELNVGLYLVECLNEKGYLTMPIEEVALACDCSMETAEKALKALQKCEPAGVGATTVQECLILQLRQTNSIEQKLARVIIKDYMDEFAHRRTMKIARKFKVMPELVEGAFEQILNLTPFPGEVFRSSHERSASTRAAAVVPDIVLTRDENGWNVEVEGTDPSSLIVSREYRRKYTEMERAFKAEKDEKRHVGTFVRRAVDFIDCLGQRRKTLRRIGEFLAERQAGFVTTGSYRFLQPLTRSQMAAELGLHESTVSRATNDKFIQIATGEVLSLDVFFKPALRVQKMIEEILERENPDSPFSDERIAELLEEQGVKVARRTVNKYRDRNKQLSSRRRRSA